MKYSKLTATFAAFALSATSVFAADASSMSDKQWLIDASKLDGTAVYDFHGTKLGDIQQVLIDPQSGRIRYGVVEVDKTWNWNDPQIAVPWGAFVVKKGDDKKPKLSIDATKDKLEKAPKYKVGDADRLFEKQASAPVYSYWSIYWWDEPMPASTDKSSSSNTTDKAGTDKSGTATTDNSSGKK